MSAVTNDATHISDLFRHFLVYTCVCAYERVLSKLLFFKIDPNKMSMSEKENIPCPHNQIWVICF